MTDHTFKKDYAPNIKSANVINTDDLHPELDDDSDIQMLIE